MPASEFLFKVVFNFRGHQPVKLNVIGCDATIALGKAMSKIEGTVEERPSSIAMEEIGQIDIR